MDYSNNRNGGGSRRGGRNGDTHTSTASSPKFSIYTEGFDYVTKAEEVIKSLLKEEKLLTTSKIRKLLAMLSDIYMSARREVSDILDDEIGTQIQYFKLHFIYEAGREDTVKKFLERAQIKEQIDGIGGNKRKLIKFCHYMEALVAYRKFLDRNDE